MKNGIKYRKKNKKKGEKRTPHKTAMPSIPQARRLCKR